MPASNTRNSSARPERARRPAAARRLRVRVANRQRRPVPARRLAAAVRAVLAAEGPPRCEISVAVVDDRTIHELNRRFLAHDYPTDVLTFNLGAGDDPLEGEIVVSADTASTAAAEHGSDAATELALYVIHGALHLIGYDDRSQADRLRMHRRQRRYLAELGLAPAPPRRKRQGSRM